MTLFSAPSQPPATSRATSREVGPALTSRTSRPPTGAGGWEGAGRSSQEVRRRNPLTTRFRPDVCPRCRHVVLAGIDADGLTTRLHPEPLDAAGEVAALAAGLPTYDLHPELDNEAVHRSRLRIVNNPAGTVRPAHAEHRCQETP